MRKVELSVMKPWIAKKVIDLLGFEDEVVIEYASGLLEDRDNPVVDGKKMYISLLGFLEKQTEPFMTELWSLLLSAQASPVKVPAIFIEQKKQEMAKRQEEQKRSSELAMTRQQNELEQQRRVEQIRERERAERGGAASDNRAGIGSVQSSSSSYDRRRYTDRYQNRSAGGDRRDRDTGRDRRYHQDERRERPRHSGDRDRRERHRDDRVSLSRRVCHLGSD